MNFRTTLILFVLVVAGLVFFIVANRSGSPYDTARDAGPGNPTEGRKLLDVKAEDVQRLVIRPAAGDTVELVRAEPDKSQPAALAAAGGSEWKIVQPAAWAADSFEARNLAESVVNLRSRGRVEAGADASAFGLDKPRFTLEVTDKNGRTSKLLVGNQAALGNDIYVRNNDSNAVSMASGGTLAEKLEKGTRKIFEDLRDKRLVTASTADVRQIEVTPRKGAKLVLHKDGADWKLTEPRQLPADAGEVASLLSAVTGLRAEEFVKADSPEAAGAMIDQPKLAVWFSKDAPSTQPAATAPATGPTTRPGGTTVAFGQFADIEREKMYVKVSPEPGALAKVAMTEASWDRIATASPVTLRDRKVLDVDPERVERVALSIDRAAATQPAAKPAEKRELVLERRRVVINQGPPAPATAPAQPVPAKPDPSKPAASSGALRQHVPGGDVVLASFEQAAPAPTDAAPAGAPPADAKPAPAAPDAPPTPAGAAAPTGPSQSAVSPSTGPAAATAPAAATSPSTVPAEPPTQWIVVTGDKKADADDVKVVTLLGGLHPLRATKYLESAPAAAVTATYVLKVHANAYGDQPAADHELKLTESGSGADAKIVGQYQGLVFEVDKFFLDRLTADFEKKKDAQATQPVAGAQ